MQGLTAQDRTSGPQRASHGTPSRCIIHIGMHKTGSTSIQLSLKGFEDQRFVYAPLGAGSNHSLPIFSLFAQHPERHHIHRSAGRGPEAIREFNDAVLVDLDASIAKARGRTLIISGEDIGVLAEPDLAKLRAHFDARFDEVLIVGYVRPPAGFIASSFQQRVKGGTIRTFEPERLYRSYQHSFGKFDRVFGRERVQLLKFDPHAFPEGDVVQDFCARFGISLPKTEIVRTNESLSAPAVAALYTYNKFAGQGEPPLRGPEGVQLGKLFEGEKFRFSPDIILPVLEKNRADIEWMEARLGQSLHEELGSHRAGDVRKEQDLLRLAPSHVASLVSTLGPTARPGVTGETPKEVALLVGALRSQMRPARKRSWLGRLMRKNDDSTPESKTGPVVRSLDVVEALRRDPKLLNGIEPDEAKALLGNAFNLIHAAIEEHGRGPVHVAGLGRFHVGRDNNGTGERRLRIRFVPLKKPGQG